MPGRQLRAYQLGLAAACIATPLLAAAESAADSADTPMSVVVVTASRSQRLSFDLPAAIEVVDAAQIGAAQARVNASEALAAVPGLVVQNRQNYAQDLQISSRGFGARSAFGVRGVKLIADGIPATMPDGQGQAATFDLDLAGRIEVLRGPLATLYGNHAGGVVQLFSREPQAAPSVELNVTGGSDGMRKTDLNAGGKQDGFSWQLDGSHFEIDGYRAHSAASRDQAYAKLTFGVHPDARLTLVASGLRQDDTQDPLGVTWGTDQRDPRADEIDRTDTETPQRTLAERYDTRKSIDHQQAGLSWDQLLGGDRLHLTLYGGNRRVIQYQSFSKALQAPATHSGGVVDFQRDFYGFELNWQGERSFSGGSLRTMVGLEYGQSTDARQGFENFSGDQLGVKGRLRRDEDDVVRNVDPYLQLEWERGAWMLTGGLRYSRVSFDVVDHYLANGNDGGSVDYRHTTPLLSVLYKVTPALNVYASAARGFETPTLNEMFYSRAGAGFNFTLAPATSNQLELGAKAGLGHGARLNAALFQIRTHDELVVDTASGGRTSYRNAGATLRQGLELSFEAALHAGFSARMVATYLRAVYDQPFGAVERGSRLPGVPPTSFYGELAWKNVGDRFGAAVEAVANGKVHPDDANIAPAAPGYGILNVRAQATQHTQSWRLREYLRVNNVLNRTYIGSVIVGDSNQRYYEPAPGRNWMLGVSAQYQF
jgi:iron complex outermembrane receptor protein